MADRDDLPVDERRGLERRVEMLERQTNQLTMRITLTESKVDGLVEMMKSRFTAVDRGHDLIINRLNQLVPADVLTSWRKDQHDLGDRVKVLEETKQQLDGAFFLIKLLGAIAIASGIIAVVKLIKGAP